MRVKTVKLEELLLKVRPHSLNHLDHALSDTFPEGEGEEGEGEEGESAAATMSLNGSLLHGLREINEQRRLPPIVGVAVGMAVGREGKGADLPLGVDLPSEMAAMVTVGGERERSEGENANTKLEAEEENSVCDKSHTKHQT